MKNLKSNMDRFIVIIKITLSNEDNHLKSNMDRFIVSNTVILISKEKI